MCYELAKSCEWIPVWWCIIILLFYSAYISMIDNYSCPILMLYEGISSSSDPDEWSSFSDFDGFLLIFFRFSELRTTKNVNKYKFSSVDILKCK